MLWVSCSTWTQLAAPCSGAEHRSHESRIPCQPRRQGIHWHGPSLVPQRGDAPAAHTAQSAQDQAPAGANRGADRGAQHQLSYPKFCCLRVKLQLSGYRGTHLLQTTGLQLPWGAWRCRLRAVTSLGSVTSPARGMSSLNTAQMLIHGDASQR